MANTITETVLLNGERNVIHKVDLTSDGTAESNTLLVDASDYVDIALQELRLDRLQWSMGAFTIDLYWDATANVQFYHIAGPGEDEVHFKQPIHNTAGAGKTGDILFTTTGLAAGENLSLILYLKKRSVT